MTHAEDGAQAAQMLSWETRASQGIAIERELRAEIERLTSENAMIFTKADCFVQVADALATANEHLRAEIARLNAKIAYVRQRSQRACEILNEFDNTRAALEPKP